MTREKLQRIGCFLCCVLATCVFAPGGPCEELDPPSASVESATPPPVGSETQEPLIQDSKSGLATSSAPKTEILDANEPSKDETASSDMTILESAVIGLVEGVTEYLPVSSTGHILLTQRWMGIEETEASNAYAIVIQAGAIAAVMLIYFGRFKQVFRGVFLGDASGRKLAINIMVAFLPAAVIGLSFNDAIEEHLFGLQPIVWAWFVGGLLILRVAARQKSRANEGIDLAGLTWQSALIIGFAQCVAMWPGTSRSLVTILGGTLIGLRLASAVEFSFLLGMVTLLAATAYSTLKSGAVMIEAYGIDCLLVGFATAGISAFIAVKWMVSYLNKNGLEIFGWYRIALAAVVFGLMYFGQL